MSEKLSLNSSDHVLDITEFGPQLEKMFKLRGRTRREIAMTLKVEKYPWLADVQFFGTPEKRAALIKRWYYDIPRERDVARWNHDWYGA
jgi:hypothetical protein